MSAASDLALRAEAPARRALDKPALRLGVAVTAVALAAAGLAYFPAWAAVIVAVVLGLAIAAPGAADAAVARGHDLRKYTLDSPLRRLKQGAGLRIGWRGAVGSLLGALLMVRLAAGSAGVWLAALAVVAMVWAACHLGAPVIAHHRTRMHRAAALRLGARVVGAVGALLAAALLGLFGWITDPAAEPTAASALVDQAFAAHRLWAGVEAFALAEAAALGLISPVVEQIVAALLIALSGAVVAELTLAALMSPQDWRRAVATASDAPTPGAPHPGAPLAAALLLATTLGAALWADRWLHAQLPEARPVSSLQTEVERIAGRPFPPGAYATAMKGRADLVAGDAALAVSLQGLVDDGFDAMIANVDPFLDAYYSLTAEYLRLWSLAQGWMTGRGSTTLEAALQARMEAALHDPGAFAPLHDALAQSGIDQWMDAAQAQETALMAPMFDAVNPARLRVVAEFAAIPPFPELRTPGLSTRLETRIGASGLTGGLAAVVAQRVAARLAARGVIRLGVRAALAAVPLVGGAAAVGADGTMLRIEEHLNRAAFREEIVAAIDAQRAEMLATLGAS